MQYSYRVAIIGVKKSKVIENSVPDAGYRVVGLVSLVFASGFSSAQSTVSSGSAPATLNPVVITGTRVEQSSFSLPMSIDAVEAADIQEGRPRVNLSESLALFPASSFKTGRITRRICRYPAVASVHAPLSVFAASG